MKKVFILNNKVVGVVDYMTGKSGVKIVGPNNSEEIEVSDEIPVAVGNTYNPKDLTFL